MTVIPLGVRLLTRSSDLPASSASSVNACLLGLAPDGGYRVSPAAVRVFARLLRLVSVALFIASRRPAVSRHPALWSPDFPLYTEVHSDCLASFQFNYIT